MTQLLYGLIFFLLVGAVTLALGLVIRSSLWLVLVGSLLIAAVPTLYSLIDLGHIDPFMAATSVLLLPPTAFAVSITVVLRRVIGSWIATSKK